MELNEKVISIELIQRNGDVVDTEPFHLPEPAYCEYEVFAQVRLSGESTFDIELEHTFKTYAEADAFRKGMQSMVEFLNN
tara:strand:- start:438 stop:677 length:240 start_codon:yes stop_codon:yes gene_type:complete